MLDHQLMLCVRRRKKNQNVECVEGETSTLKRISHHYSRILLLIWSNLQ